MRGMYLDELSMAGGEGSRIAAGELNMKRFGEYRMKNGRDDRRP